MRLFRHYKVTTNFAYMQIFYREFIKNLCIVDKICKKCRVSALFLPKYLHMSKNCCTFASAFVESENVAKLLFVQCCFSHDCLTVIACLFGTRHMTQLKESHVFDS